MLTPISNNKRTQLCKLGLFAFFEARLGECCLVYPITTKLTELYYNKCVNIRMTAKKKEKKCHFEKHSSSPLSRS